MTSFVICRVKFLGPNDGSREPDEVAECIYYVVYSAVRNDEKQGSQGFTWGQ